MGARWSKLMAQGIGQGASIEQGKGGLGESREGP